MKLLVYTSDNPLKQPQTGGDKRFEEFARYACVMADADVCGAFSRDEAEKAGINCKYKIRKSEKGLLSKFPPVIRTIIQNCNLLKRIKQERYARIIVFDVPIAFPLCFFHTQNIVLLVRKDLIGYEGYSSAHKGLSKKLYMLAKILMESVCLKRCKKIVVQCEYDKEQLLNRHSRIKGKIRNKFHVQINNINPRWIVNNKRNNLFQSKLENSYFNICFVGNFNNIRKGQDLFLKAARYLKNKYDDMCFHVIGNGKDLDRYKADFASDRIIFYGRMENPGEIICRSDLMVVPSYADSCPNTVLEALYLGVAVIGSKRGGIPEILMDEDSLFDIDIESLSEKITVLYKNKELLETLLKKQRLRAEELTFNWSERIMAIVTGE